MDPTHYFIGVARTQMTKINHRGDARVNYTRALPNCTISSVKQQKLLLALGSNMRVCCLGKERQSGDCQWKDWEILHVWRWAWKRRGRNSRRFSRRKTSKYLRTGIWNMHLLHTHICTQKSNSGNIAKQVKVSGFHLQSLSLCSWQEQFLSFSVACFSQRISIFWSFLKQICSL